jgi:hypothetical protein
LGFDFAIIFVWYVPWYLASHYALEGVLKNGHRLSWLRAAIFLSLAVLVFGQTSSFAFGAALTLTFGCYLLLNRHRLYPKLIARAAVISTFLGLLFFIYFFRIRENDYFPGAEYMDWSLFLEPGALLVFMSSSLAVYL